MNKEKLHVCLLFPAVLNEISFSYFTRIRHKAVIKPCGIFSKGLT